MAKYLIKPPSEILSFQKKAADEMLISEVFYDAVQGEGPTTGVPAIFIRFAGCTLNCKWCDSKHLWTKHIKISVDDLFMQMNQEGLIDKLENGVHLIFTGGSPLLQQHTILLLLHKIYAVAQFYPNIEIENEGIIYPHTDLISYRGNIHWNNSLKLSNSGNKAPEYLYNIRILEILNSVENSSFKFVVTNEEDIAEIKKVFLPHISRSKVLLMPQGVNRRELEKNAVTVLELAIKHGFKYCHRLHIQLFDDKDGV